MTIRIFAAKRVRIIVCVMIAVTVAFAYTCEQAFAAVPKVSGVKARVVADRTVQVSWKKKAGVDGYTVYVATKKRGKYRAKATVGGDATSGKVKRLKVGKTYYFKVRSFAMSGNRKVYSRDSKRVKCLVKVAPPKVTATAVTASFETKKIKITFTKSTGAKGYEIWRAKSKGGKYKKIKTLTARSYTDAKLSANTAYYYKVRAFSKKKKKKVYSKYSSVVQEWSGGNSHRFDPARQKAKGNSSLKGKKILFLGSSVTRGRSSDGVSFVDYLRAIDGVKSTKEAVDSTTISFANDGRSYGARLERYKKTDGFDLVVCQLSTNDSKNIYRETNRGEDTNVQVFDETDNAVQPFTSTTKKAEKQDLAELREKAATPDENGNYYVEDGLKYIEAYANIELGCPVVFYTVVPFKKKYNSADPVFYEKMIECLNRVAGEWAVDSGFNASVINFYNDPNYKEFKDYNSKRGFYMKDDVHPTKAGYLEKYLPGFEVIISDILK